MMLPLQGFRAPHDKSCCFKAGFIQLWGRLWRGDGADLGLQEYFQQFANTANMQGPIHQATFTNLHQNIEQRRIELETLSIRILADQRSSEGGPTGTRVGNVTGWVVAGVSYTPLVAMSILALYCWTQGKPIDEGVTTVLGMLGTAGKIISDGFWQKNIYSAQRTGSLETIPKEQQVPEAQAIARFTAKVNELAESLPNPVTDVAAERLTALDELFTKLPNDAQAKIGYYHLKQRLINSLQDGHQLKDILTTYINQAYALNAVNKNENIDNYNHIKAARNSAKNKLVKRVGVMKVVTGPGQIFYESKFANGHGQGEAVVHVPLEELQQVQPPPLGPQPPQHNWYHHLPCVGMP